MRSLVLTALLTVTSSASAFETWFEPATPNSQSFVTVQARTYVMCLQWTGAVTRIGKTIEIVWSRIPGCVGIPEALPWAGHAAIGVLDPGVYEVRMSLEGLSSRVERLVVADAAPPFQVEPRTVPVAGGETVAIVRDELGECRFAQEVAIDGVPVPLVELGCSWATVVAPPHMPGAVDVAVRYADGTRTSRSALHYVDPTAAPDESAFERVLVPLLYNGPGAYGSEWVTEGTMFPVHSDRPLRWMHDVVNAECASGACEGSIVDLASFGNHPAGLLLFVPRDLRRVEAKLFVRDVSRSAASWGAQVPIVRESDFSRGEPFFFPNVPFDAPYRTLLRIYGVDGGSSHVTVLAGGQSRSIPLTGACGFEVTRCNSARPAFAAVDLQQTFPELAGRGRFSVTVDPSDGLGVRYWTFLSLTNNDTQQVTVVTP